MLALNLCHHTSANNALTLRHGGQEQEVDVPWVAGTIALQKGSNHTYSPGASTVMEEGSVGPVQGRRKCETVSTPRKAWYF